MTSIEKLQAAIGVVGILRDLKEKSDSEKEAYEAALKVVKESLS